MPQIPTYTGRRTPNVTPVSTRDTSTFQAIGDAASQLGEHFIQIGQERKRRQEELDRRFNALKTLQETSAAEVSLIQGVSALKDESLNSDEQDEQAYIDGISKLRQDSLALITDEEAKIRFQAKFEVQAQRALVDIQKNLRKRKIQQTVADSETKMSALSKMYVSAEDELSQREARADIMGTIDDLVASGAWTPEKGREKKEFYDKELPYQEALHDAEADPVSMVENIDEYDLTPEQKIDITNKAKSLSEIRKKELDIAQQIKYTDNQSRLIGLIGDPDISYIDKLNEIQSAVNNFELPEKEGKILIANLNSKNAVDAKTYNQDLVFITRMIGDLQKDFNEDSDRDDGRAYLKRLRDVKDEIIVRHSKGRLSVEDKDKLLQSIEQNVIKEGREASRLLKEESFLQGIGWHYGDADKYFKNNLVNSGLQDEAMRQYFYATEDVKGWAERKDIAKKITRQLNQNNLSEIATTPSFNTPEEAEAANLPKGSKVIIAGQLYRVD